MEVKEKLGRRDPLCVNVNKVYDWIVESSTSSTTVPVIDLPIPLAADATDMEVNCILTNSAGLPLPLNTELEVTETSPRVDHQFTIGGRPVVLQQVSFTKTLYVLLKITGVVPETGTPFVITTNPISFTFMETAFLCAPAGTLLAVRVSNFNSLSVVERDETAAITGFGLNISICQSIQTIAPVTVELDAHHCRPRPPVMESCGKPEVPQDCNRVFPMD